MPVKQKPHQEQPKEQERTTIAKLRVCDVAARMFNQDSIDGVSVEAIIKEADISRSTFYRFFDDKNDVVKQAVTPIFIEAHAHLLAIDKDKSEDIVNGIAQSYLSIWEHASQRLILSSTMGLELFALVEEEHNAQAALIMNLMTKLYEARMLRNDEPDLAALLIARTAVRILEACAQHDHYEALFISTLRGMLLKW